MVDLPFVEVSHLASSTSFYSAIFQPLGLQYLQPCTPAQEIIATSALYGGDRGGAIAARQSKHPLKPPRLSRIVFATPSRGAVASFYSCALKANPPSWSGVEKVDPNNPYDARTWKAKGREPSLITDSHTNQAIVYDLDGNRIEVVYQPQRRSSASSDKSGSRRCEPARVIEWDFEYESTIVGNRNAMAPNRAATASSVTPSSIQSSAASLDRQDSTSPRQSSKAGGLNTNTVMGTVLGVAAGAALAYGWFTSSGTKQEEPQQQQQPMHERPFAGRGQLPRRATFDDKAPAAHPPPPSSIHRRQSYQDHAHPRDSRDSLEEEEEDDENDPRVIRDPNDPRYVPTALVYVDEATPRNYDGFDLPLRTGGQYGEDDAGVEYENPWANEPRYMSQTQAPPSHSRAASHVSRSRHAEEHRAPSHVSRHSRAVEEPRAPSHVSRSRPVEDNFDTRSRASRHTARPPSGRTRSETRTPKSVHEDDVDRRSQAPSRRKGGAESVVSRPPTTTRGRREAYGGEGEAYPTPPSSRSKSQRRSEYRHDEPEYVPKKGRPSSRVSAAAVPRESHRRAGSTVSRSDRHTPRSGGSGWDPREAREVPLPMSNAGSSHAGYDEEPEWDDDLVSLAPSDSISCAGIKASRRMKSRH